MMKRQENLFTVEHGVTAEARLAAAGHRGGILWMTGLSGAGKSTLAMALEAQLHRRGYRVYVLDGDNVRGGLNADLGFSPDDRTENIRRVGQVAALFADAGLIVISAFISPYQADRDMARGILPGAFHEVHVRASLPACEGRDPKGLYARARAGEIADFTGISAPYEEPLDAELTIDTENHDIVGCLDRLGLYVERHFAIDAARRWAA